MGLKDVLAHAWNAFTPVPEPTNTNWTGGGGTVTYGGLPPSRIRTRTSNDKTIITSIYTRLSIDLSSVNVAHVKVDQNGRYLDTVNSYLNDCLTVEANTDQAARAFMRDVAMTLCEKGIVAIVPVDTTINPNVSMGYDIQSLRVGEIAEWFPDRVRINLYNEKTGKRQDITLPKKQVAIVENPLYSVMNETNGTLQRLIRKLNLLDSIDEQTGSGKLDIIIQLPYVIKSEARKQQANQRRKDLEEQLSGSKYGVAYTDGTERITQLNRPAENNMLAQIETLQKSLYAQLGLTEDVFNGTANEATMLNYFNRTIEPIMAEITQEMHRSFLSKTARTQGHKIQYSRDPFKLLTISTIADIADKFIRNKVGTANEIRSLVGWKPSTESDADKLVNPNMPEQAPPPQGAPQPAVL